jgi:glycosyltransferase involved in cell wall biosynthesis
MRNVLLVTYSYPPVERSGARRPAALAKYLPRFGWRPVILTPRIEGAPRNDEFVTETDYRDVLVDWKAKLRLDQHRTLHEQFGLSLSKQAGADKPHTLAITVLKNLLTFPDLTKGWIPYAVKAVEDIKRANQPIDAIITTFPPASAHMIGARAKQILGVPWIADFRDLWTQDITTMRPRDLQFLQVPLEKKTLRTADVLIGVSDPWSARLAGRYRSHDVVTVPNGFDPDDFHPRPAVTRKFTITYAGVLYQGQRDPSLLFETLSNLIRENVIPAADVLVRFYAPPEAWLLPLVRRFGLEPVVELNGIVKRKEVLQREMESHILLLLSWTNPKDTGLHTGKLFEYLGAERPILAIGGNRGVLTQVLEETGAGIHASSKDEVRNFLVQSYVEYKQQGYVACRGDASAVARYSHLEMSHSFAQALDSVCGRIKSETWTTNPEMACS